METTPTLCIGFHGIPGALTEGALHSLVQLQRTGTLFNNHHVKSVPFETLDTLFAALHDHEVDYIMLPVENTRSGTIHSTMDRLIGSTPSMYVVGEYVYNEPYCLLAPEGTQLEQITEVHSHPHVLAQCREFITERLPHGQHMVLVQGESTASSAKRVADLTQRDRLSILHHMRRVDCPRLPTTSSVQHGVRPFTLDEPHRAAIAGESAAKLYKLDVLERDIARDKNPLTRYFLMGLQPVEPERHQSPKTSLVITVANRSGALFKVLGCFALRDINVCKLESRPSRRTTQRSRLSAPWEYTIYLDLDGSATVDEA
ncbi:hypothetical protein IWQ62_006554, partial [Dispira parvispora]